MELTKKQIKDIKELTGYSYSRGYNHNDLGTFEQWFVKAKFTKEKLFGIITNNIFYNEKENKLIFTNVVTCRYTYKIYNEKTEPFKKWIAPLAKILGENNEETK